jgi:MFS family permease
MDTTDESERSMPRASAAARANLAGSLGMVWAAFGAPGSILLTLFLKEWLHAAKWQIGLVMTMTYLGTTFEVPGAYLVERLGRRRAQFLSTYLINRLGFFVIAALPLLLARDTGRELGIAVVLTIIGVTRVAAHVGTPAWWSWMADLVPQRCRGRFFACRNQWSSAVTAISFVTGLLLLQTCGGMDNDVLVSALFAVGAAFGTLDILLYLKMPEPPLKANGTRAPFLASLAAPFRHPAFRRLIFGMGLWSFSANLMLPFLPVYQRGEQVAGQQLGLSVSWLFLAAMNTLGSLAGFLSSRHWGQWAGRVGPRRLLLVGSGYLFVNLAYLFMPPGNGLWLLLPVALVGGALNAAWTVASHQLLLAVAPRANRSYYVSAYNVIGGWLMAGGPLLGGLLADRAPLLSWHLPGGMPCCYFHILILLAAVGGMIGLIFLARVPTEKEGQASLRRLIRVRFHVSWLRGRVGREPVAG